MRLALILRFLPLSVLGLVFQSGPSVFAGLTESQIARVLEHHNRGGAFMDQYKFLEASKEFLSILELDPSILPSKVNLGIAYYYDQKYEEAEKLLKEVVSVEPAQIQSHFVLGLIYRNQDRVEEAIAEFEAVKKQDPTDSSTNYYLGRLYMRQRDYDRAASYFREVIQKEPYNASAHYNLATVLSRKGLADEGRKEMDEFRRLQELFGSTTVGLQYLEQGLYAIALDQIDEKYLPGSRRVSGGEVPVTFTEVAAQAGLSFRHSGPGKAGLIVSSKEELENRVVPYFGSGLSFGDFDQDGNLDLFLANAGAAAAQSVLYRNRGDGTFVDATKAAGLSFRGKTMQGIWGDYDNDGFPDLYLVNYGPNVLYHNQKNGTFVDVTDQTRTGDAGWGMGATFVDYDHDGDLDIFVANFIRPGEVPSASARFPQDFRGADNVLLRNNGTGTFDDVTAVSKLGGGTRKTLGVLTSDLDNSRDVDFLLINVGAPTQLFQNMRDGSFAESPQVLKTAGGELPLGVGAGDVNRDGMVDLAISSQNPGKTEILLNRGNSRFERMPSDPGRSLLSSEVSLNVHFLDFDNDGDLDILYVASPLLEEPRNLTRQRNLWLLRNDNGSWKDVSTETGLAQITGKPLRGLGVADFDNDGDLDLALSVNGGSPLLLRNDGGNANNWIALRPEGTNSNWSGIGVKAEVKSGAFWEKVELSGGGGFLEQSSPVLHFGLGRRDKVDVVRLLWPNGVLQSELDHPANKQIALQELDRKGTSCPILYVWDGVSYRFQTDFLGGSAFGSLLAPGIYNYPDTDEYVKLNREDVALKDGKISVTMNNQLEEVIFFDHVRMLVIDHPGEFEVFPDEKLLPGPPYQGFQLFTVSGARPPLSATDSEGRDLLASITARDRVYAENFDRLGFKGYATPHDIILDLGDVPADRVILLLHAWIDYADSTSNLAASQAGVKLVPPYVQVRDAKGNWVTVLERMGFPAGLPKTMTVDLSGRFLSESRKVRIVTNMRIYWDQILVESGRPRDDFRINTLAPSMADLHFKGFPEFSSPDGKKPNTYSYDRVEITYPWKVHVGGYTRFGDVTSLLETKDDMFVITRSGDEVEVLFDPTGLPELPAGWVRDYLLYVDGFGKDMDPNSASPHFLGPLPFHGMSAYPYPSEERYPESQEYRKYLEQWNTRVYEEAVPDLRRADAGRR